jgi:hypothetical protein
MQSHLARLGVRLGIPALILLFAAAAGATSIDFTLMPFTGDPSEVEITLDDMAAGDGKIEIRVEVTQGVGDIRGVLFNITDDDLLDGLMITGDDVTGVKFRDVINLGRGANLYGGGSPCPCDIGVAIGLPGLRGGHDDLMSTTFVLMHETVDLDLSIFRDQLFGVRLTSVGDDCDREGSTKLRGVVPEPGTGLLLGAGLIALGARSRSGRV